jgi:ankyrin repeat protein
VVNPISSTNCGANSPTTSSLSCGQSQPTIVEDLDSDACCSLIDACNEGDLEAVRRLLEEGRNVNEMTDEGESLLSLACSSGYLELAQLLLTTTRANVEERGLKDTTPLMEAASAGHFDIVRLLLDHVSFLLLLIELLFSTPHAF